MEKEFSKIYELYFDRVHLFIFRKIGNIETARDIAQDVFLKAFSAMKSGNYKEIGFIRGFIFKTSQNEAINYMRKRHNRIIPYGDCRVFRDSTNFDDPLKSMCFNEQCENALNIIERLNPLYFDAFKLRYLEGLSFKDITEELNISMGALKSRLFLCDKTLKEKGFIVYRKKDHKRNPNLVLSNMRRSQIKSIFDIV